MEQKYRLPYGVASSKDSRGIVYGKFYKDGFKIGCSCEKNANKRLKESYGLLGKKIAEEVRVETRFHMHLEEKFKVYLREFGFCHHEQGAESFQYRDDIPKEDMRTLLKEILELSLGSYEYLVFVRTYLGVEVFRISSHLQKLRPNLIYRNIPFRPIGSRNILESGLVSLTLLVLLSLNLTGKFISRCS